MGDGCCWSFPEQFRSALVKWGGSIVQGGSEEQVELWISRIPAWRWLRSSKIPMRRSFPLLKIQLISTHKSTRMAYMSRYSTTQRSHWKSTIPAHPSCIRDNGKWDARCSLGLCMTLARHLMHCPLGRRGAWRRCSLRIDWWLWRKGRHRWWGGWSLWWGRRLVL